MIISNLFESSSLIQSYTIRDYRKWATGFYYNLTITFHDGSTLFAREYLDTESRKYAFHWQDAAQQLLMRWDNTPHHPAISTHPHHKHIGTEVTESREMTLVEVLDFIRSRIALEDNNFRTPDPVINHIKSKKLIVNDLRQYILRCAG